MTKMNREQFVDEMLEEVKNLKDLAKEELPEVAREYIRANKVQHWAGLVLGSLFMWAGGYTAAEAYFGTFSDYSYKPLICGVIAAILSIPGILLSIGCVSGLFDLYLQPRRMAIKAITSLKGE